MNFEMMDLEERTAITHYAIEANGFEISILYNKYKDIMKWEQILGGYGKHIIGGGFLSLRWFIINNVPVLFYEVTSDEVKFSVVESWIKSNFKILEMTDSSNAYRIFNQIKEAVA